MAGAAVSASVAMPVALPALVLVKSKHDALSRFHQAKIYLKTPYART